MHILVTCKYKTDRIKNNREKVETPFSLLLVNGVFLLLCTPEFWSNLPQKIMQPFPTPSDATCKIWSRLANWPQRYSSSKVYFFFFFFFFFFFAIQGQVTRKLVVWSSPKSNSSELLCLSWLPATLMVIRSKMNELAGRQHFPIIVHGNFFRRSKVANSVVSGPIWPIFWWSEILCMSSLPASIKKIGSKTTEKRWKHRFNHYKSIGAFCCHGNQCFCSNLPHNLTQYFPDPSDASRKFWSRLAYWLQRYSRLKVWTTDDDGRTTDHWYTMSSPCNWANKAKSCRYI